MISTYDQEDRFFLDDGPKHVKNITSESCVCRRFGVGMFAAGVAL
jgi:hypothetical protein